jgi:CDP-glucose 4,6-dehydratase
MLGAWLIKELLAREATVIALIRAPNPLSELNRSGDARRVSVVPGVIEDFPVLEEAVALHEVEVVFHLAARGDVPAAHDSPLPTLESNIRGTYNLLEACRRAQPRVRKIVIASSDKAYGEQALPYTEQSPLLGLHPYTVSKSCSDLLAQAYFHTYRLPLAIVRCGNTFGGGDLNWGRIVPSTIRSCLRGVRPVIRSDGRGLRDYVYVKDAVAAYLLIAEALESERFHGEAFNISDEHPISVLDLVRTIQRLMNCESLTPDVRDTAKGEIRDMYLCAAKARDMLEWRARYSLEEGLRETIAWYTRVAESSPLST